MRKLLQIALTGELLDKVWTIVGSSAWRCGVLRSWSWRYFLLCVLQVKLADKRRTGLNWTSPGKATPHRPTRLLQLVVWCRTWTANLLCSALCWWCCSRSPSCSVLSLSLLRWLVVVTGSALRLVRRAWGESTEGSRRWGLWKTRWKIINYVRYHPVPKDSSIKFENYHLKHFFLQKTIGSLTMFQYFLLCTPWKKWCFNPREDKCDK